jgi:hypothetical protein
MSVEIKFGGTCRDLDKLPSSDAELRNFFETQLMPAIWDDFSKNVIAARSPAFRGRAVNIGVTERGCEIGGEIVIRL